MGVLLLSGFLEAEGLLKMVKRWLKLILSLAFFFSPAPLLIYFCSSPPCLSVFPPFVLSLAFFLVCFAFLFVSFASFSLSLSPVGSLSPPNSPVLASCCVPGVTSSLEAEKWKRDGGLAAFFLRCSWSLSVASSVSLRRNRGTKVFFLLLFSPPRFCPSLYCIFFFCGLSFSGFYSQRTMPFHPLIAGVMVVAGG